MLYGTAHDFYALARNQDWLAVYIFPRVTLPALFYGLANSVQALAYDFTKGLRRVRIYLSLENALRLLVVRIFGVEIYRRQLIHCNLIGNIQFLHHKHREVPYSKGKRLAEQQSVAADYAVG